MTAIDLLRPVDIVFGPSPKDALALLDRGESRDLILEQTGEPRRQRGRDARRAARRDLVLMGLSGSGKSTLLRSPTRLTCARGRVLVTRTTTSRSTSPLRREDAAPDPHARVSWCSSGSPCCRGARVRHNVGFGLEVKGEAAEGERIVDEKLELVGLAPWKRQVHARALGGMQQRVGLARAFATDPDVSCSDEPFSALDPLIRRSCRPTCSRCSASSRRR